MDEFVKEVDDELKQEKLEAFWKKYGVSIIGAAVAVVVGTGGWTYWSHQKREAQETNSHLYSEALAALEDGHKDMAKTKFEELATQGGAYGEFAQLKLASLALQGGKPKDAEAIYQKLAGDKKAEFIFRDVAVLFGAYSALDQAPTKTVESLGAALERGSSPLSQSLLEAKAWAHLGMGQKQEAIRLFKAILESKAAPEGVMLRAQVALTNSVK